MFPDTDFNSFNVTPSRLLLLVIPLKTKES